MRIDFKPGVRINHRHFRPHISRVLYVCAESAPSLLDDTMIVTSANDSKHSRGSKHYIDDAWDVRCLASDPHLPGTVLAMDEEERNRIAEQWATRIARQLGQQYDVVLEKGHVRVEGSLVPVMHIHIEYDPKEVIE